MGCSAWGLALQAPFARSPVRAQESSRGFLLPGCFRFFCGGTSLGSVCVLGGAIFSRSQSSHVSGSASLCLFLPADHPLPPRQIGTPLPALADTKRDAGEFVPVWKQEVRDEQGRRRFHGAFTGGFSAGYYNSVGSKEGE